MTSLLSPCVLYTRFYPPVAKLTTLPFAPRTGRVVGAGFKPAPSQRGCAKFNATNHPTTTDVTVIPDSPRHSRNHPRHSRTLTPSFPRTREPSEKQTTPITPPSQSEGGRERSEQGDARSPIAAHPHQLDPARHL